MNKGKTTFAILWSLVFVLIFGGFFLFYEDLPFNEKLIPKNSKAFNGWMYSLLAFIGCLILFNLGKGESKRKNTGKTLNRIPPGRYQRIIIQEEAGNLAATTHIYPFYFLRLKNLETEEKICCLISRDIIMSAPS